MPDVREGLGLRSTAEPRRTHDSGGLQPDRGISTSSRASVNSTGLGAAAAINATDGDAGLQIFLDGEAWPPFEELPLDQFKELFPEGTYTFRAPPSTGRP